MTTAVVVGSGPNGLAAAIRLAQRGLEVTVVEANDRPGGGMLSGELTLPGLVHDHCAAFHPLGVASPYLATLDLARHGLRWRWPQIDLAHPLDDGRAGVIARGWAASDASLGEDADRWRRLLGPAVRHFDDLMTEVLQPVPHLPAHPVTLGRFGIRALPPATWVSRAFRDEPARALFAGIAAHTFWRLDRPLGSAVALVLGAAAHAVGWPVAEGGSESVARAMVAELESRGGRVITGVRVATLDQLRDLHGRAPDVVVLDTAPEAAMRIVGDRLPPRIRRAFTRYRHGPAAFKVDLAIEGDIPWTNPQCRQAGTIHLGGSAAQVAQVEAATVRGEAVDRPFVLLGQQYLADPGRSNGSANPIYAYAHVPHGHRGDATETILNQIERFAPGFRDRVLAVSSRGPAELEAHNANFVGGDIAAGANSPRQIVARPRLGVDPYSLGVPGVVLCSAATPPGGGVHAMAGFHAAESALARL